MKQNLLQSLLLGPLLAVTTSIVVAQSDWPQFRGPNRDGKSLETGLLKQWPDDGPKLLRTISGFGGGFSTPVIARDRIYISGKVGGVLHIYSISE